MKNISHLLRGPFYFILFIYDVAVEKDGSCLANILNNLHIIKSSN